MELTTLLALFSRLLEGLQVATDIITSHIVH